MQLNHGAWCGSESSIACWRVGLALFLGLAAAGAGDSWPPRRARAAAATSRRVATIIHQQTDEKKSNLNGPTHSLKEQRR